MSASVLVLTAVALPLALLVLVLWWGEKRRRGRREFWVVVAEDEELAELNEIWRLPAAERDRRA